MSRKEAVDPVNSIAGGPVDDSRFFEHGRYTVDVAFCYDILGFLRKALTSGDTGIRVRRRMKVLTFKLGCFYSRNTPFTPF